MTSTKRNFCSVLFCSDCTGTASPFAMAGATSKHPMLPVDDALAIVLRETEPSPCVLNADVVYLLLRVMHTQLAGCNLSLCRLGHLLCDASAGINCSVATTQRVYTPVNFVWPFVRAVFFRSKRCQPHVHLSYDHKFS